ncbi:MAG: hypothetical protein HN975_08635 [Anaerolineae bacterium]|jgi:hypothetical protein|nr:hypothetical protein [Anaerolineae bacterium]
MQNTLPSPLQSFLLDDAERRDLVTARRVNLMRILLREQYLSREALIERVEYLLGNAAFGEKSWEDNFYRDMRVVKAGFKAAGYELKYSRQKGRAGYYLAGNPALGTAPQAEIRGALAELDDAQMQIYKQMPAAQKFRQSVSIIDFGRQVQQRTQTP